MIWASVKRSLFIRIFSFHTLRKFSLKSHSFYGGVTVFDADPLAVRVPALVAVTLQCLDSH
ncbi:hypothetical protein HNR55_003214 [Acetobacter lovaniensis]|jgi:hypothetical protein|uniref:Uncharacterized protein n=1 Tax=Acetobacter lovaniensis TaxID=104100 RepID=A0A841QKG7_9PROT|nr:hypothetical protein [Acetobacter lovaniensis]